MIFRNTFSQIEQEGGLWDKSLELYPLLGSRANISKRTHIFPSGSKLRFAHLEHESDIYNYQGGEIAFLGFDEITHFTEKAVFYLISRNRSTSGVRPYVRATCNPDPDSWVARFISWWIDEEGYPIARRSGIVRWFARFNDEIVWANTKQELLESYPALDPFAPMSFTFVAATLADNQALTTKDPQYKAKLLALPRVERMRLLGDEKKGGNWKVREARGEVFRREWFEIVDTVPANLPAVRAWDFAATKPNPQNPDPDWTIGLRLERDEQGVMYVTDVRRLQGTPAEVERLFINTVKQDGKTMIQHIPQDPGEAGKAMAQKRVNFNELQGHAVIAQRVTGEKIVRAQSASSKAEQGLIKMVRAPWNRFVLNQLEAFPEAPHDDVVDALSDAVNNAPMRSTIKVEGVAAG